MHNRAITLVIGLLALAAGGCPRNEPRTLAVFVYGEEFIESGIPSTETDGWTIQFEKFLLNAGEVKLQRDGFLIASFSGAAVFDLSRASSGTGFPVAELTANTSSGLHEVSYRVFPATTAAMGNATADDAAFMAANGYSIYFEIVATNGAIRKTMSLGFSVDATYSGCFTTLDFESADGGRIELTIHGDHLFYADTGDDPLVRFADLAAADSNNDGEITSAELQAIGLDASVGASTLLELITKLAATLGHINGEGHCASVTVR